MLASASSFGSLVDDAFYFILIVSLIFFIGITFAMLYFVFRYHHTRNEKASNIHGNLVLEVLWTVVPTLLVLAMFYYGFIGYNEMRTIPENAMEVGVTGRMWSWAYQYENGYQTDTLFVPVDQPVKMRIESADVLHSFYIPAFRIKQDAVPGMVNYLWFKAEEAGDYDVLCAEYCGDRHSYMYSKVVALPRSEFDQWYASREVSAPAAGTAEAGGEKTAGRKGKSLYRLKGCVACHSTDGTRLVGPSFKGIFGESVSVISSGEERQVIVDEEYIHRSIKQPDADKVKGYENLVMPPQALTDEEIEALVEFIKELK